MKGSNHMDRLRRIGAAGALAMLVAVVAAGCGGNKTDVSQGVDSYNERFSQQGYPVRFDCPKEVDGGDGTEFDCDLKATEGDKKAKVKMEVKKEGEDLVVDVKDQAAFEKALAQVAGQAAQGQGQQGQQPGGQAPGGQAPAPEQPGGQAPAPEQPGGGGETP
jgi:hypothetical protein